MTVMLDSQGKQGVRVQARQRPALSTCRDYEPVRYVARQGVVTPTQVMAGIDISRSGLYRSLGRCLEGGLVEHFRLPLVAVKFLRATRKGLRYAGLADLTVAMASLGSIEHQLYCVDVAQVLGKELGPESVLIEREILALERAEGRRMYSAKAASGSYHRPDLVAISPDGLVAVEVELSPKGPKRLNKIVEAWNRTSWPKEVRYHCPPGPTYRAVERAIAQANAAKAIRLFELPTP